MKKTKIFKHFMTCLYIGAISLPILFVCVEVCRDVFPKMFSSWAVARYGGDTDSFEDDVDYSITSFQFNDFNDTLMNVMDNFHYYNYDNSITNLEEWITDNNGSSYTDVSQNTSSKFIINFSVVSLFDNGIVMNGNNVAPYLFLDFMFNYLINASLICFLPECILCFVSWARDLVYVFLDKEKEVK